MKISYVMIVLNGMPFIEFSLRAIYDSAHEIVIVEGAVKDCMFAANSDGSSIDGTVEFIKAFPDPENKIKIIQGMWPEKREMQNAALKYVSGNYVWLVDSDEVYHKQDIQKVIQVLKQNDGIMQLNLSYYPFWKGFDYYMFCPEVEWSRACGRVFKYTPGATFTQHRPITMQWPKNQHASTPYLMPDMHFFHYSYILDSQVKQKIRLYKKYRWDRVWSISLDNWYNECFLKWTPETREEIERVHPIWTGHRNSYTQRFEGAHPEVMLEYIEKFNSKI